MRHLVITALHRNESFLGEGVEKLTATLKNSGAVVNIRDLYKQGFQPVLSKGDFEALNSNRLPSDIVLEQEFIRNSDILWIVFPVWWAGMPAILKGYIDRVFLSSFAYKMKGDRPVGLLNDKKAVILNSMGMSKKDYRESGMFDALKLTIDKGIFEFSGIQVLSHNYFTSIMSATSEQRSVYLNEIVELATKFSNCQHHDLKVACKKVA